MIKKNLILKPILGLYIICKTNRTFKKWVRRLRQPIIVFAQIEKLHVPIITH